MTELRVLAILLFLEGIVLGFVIAKYREHSQRHKRFVREVGVMVMMEWLGKHGIFSWLKFDPLREKCKWSVIVNDVRRDTDDPLETILDMAEEL